MKNAFVTKELALKTLTLHPDNVRAASGAGYSEEEIAPLAANIAECGLLQPLLVAPLPEVEGKTVWGVLAGGRRLSALLALVANEATKDYTVTTKITCRVVPEAHAAQVTLSYSENALQLPMDALDRYEAFAAMREKDGADVGTIARRFSITERTVKEALRLGAIHPEIRQAHRAGELSLETLKAFDAHPDTAVQLEAYQSLSEGGGRLNEWNVRGYFEGRFVRVGDALGKLVHEAYGAAGGEIVADLIEEDSVLADQALVSKLLSAALSDAAEAAREAEGLAWSEIMLKPDWELTSKYGRVYRQPIALEGEAKEKGDQIATRLEAIEVTYGTVEEGSEAEATLQDEYDTLTEELEEMCSAYSEFDAALGGVLAIWTGREIRLHTGMVRPEDMPALKGEAEGAASVSQDQPPVQDKWSEKLARDMAHVRTRAIGLALAQSPELARDYADYTLIQSVLEPYSIHGVSTTMKGEVAARSAEDCEGNLKSIEDVFATLAEGLDMSWLELDEDESFAAFRALEAEARASILAYAVAQTLSPGLYGARLNPVRRLVEAEALPRIREVWMPDATYFARLTKPALLAILREDLDMRSQADAHEKSKKSELVDYMDGLFAAPFATLSSVQREAVQNWAPKAMRTAEIAKPEEVDAPALSAAAA